MNTLIISGALGRMGQMIAGEAANQGFSVVAGIDQASFSAPYPIFTSYDEPLPQADVLIDFSRPQALPKLLAYAESQNLPCVIGTTGLSLEDQALLEKAALSLPIFQSANMSLGVYALKRACALVSKLLPGFDIEIVEKHHNAKADSPSGTALQLLDAVKGPQSLPIYGRHGADARRKPEEIGLHAVRGGTVAGEHEVGFYGINEQICLSHLAQSRAVFAVGALKAAAFLIGKKPGLYGMDELMA